MILARRQAAAWDSPGRAGLTWLGQAGFWIDTGHHRLLIDPYLSDSLARKYAGRRHDHRRMMPPPITPEALPRPDLVLVTHAHTDHMDPDTLGPLAARCPDLPFVVPAACEAIARERIGAGARLVLVDAGERIEPLPGLRLTVLPAAHETRDTDAQGRHLFLGYAVGFADTILYHSGDCVPFAGLEGLLCDLSPGIVLLPVNGRDAARREAGIPGNFTLEEAVALAQKAGAAVLVPHHFGLFAFNTCEPAAIDRLAAVTDRPAILRPRPGETLHPRQEPDAAGMPLLPGR
ncbi:putative Zn-dependent hydrolase of the beta-lactamase fold protein [Rubellimicrobium thermophilum DSM 16684]|uniref:Putative Zn-dependent hydrolase of the beta-lactamase fold protein n=1 Tax=Rubellimicrobium thermophilum DSM 16684 TaxID=1123069 RepID=S9S0G0_9RHOB|nr:MBL fold metallo-hydrolase [Rubellimicrobium thermophilum]EPX83710.1 putative Zn-dependent hydrolase of the beta-lactamase fold protein [Rubellimicrobium thermophilum DSM 16684]